MQTLKTPGIYRSEIDKSEVTAPAGTSVGAIVLSARQGIANSRRLITTDQELISVFGQPNADSSDAGIYAGMEFLKESDSLYVVRATSGSEQYSNIVLSGAGTALSASNAVTVAALSTTALLAVANDGNKADAIYELDNATFSGNMLIAVTGPGTYGNLVGIEVYTNAVSATSLSGEYDWANKYDSPEKVFKVQVSVKAASTDAAFPSTPVETFYVTKEYLKDGNGQQMYAPAVINGISQYIYVKDSGSGAAGATMPGVIHNAGAPVALTSGVDATNYSAPLISGWTLFADKTKVSVNILIDAFKTPATTRATVANLAATRLDCMAFIQAETQTSTATMTDSDVSTFFPSGLTAGSYAAVYAGWDKIYDNFADRFVYIPKCIYGAVLAARTDSRANTWDAPAGINRGVLPSIGQNYTFNDTQIGLLYDNNINTSRNVRGTGHVMWGQKTGLRKHSALDRINVRRLLLFIENSVEPLLQSFLFELNTESTRTRVTNVIDAFMRTVEAGNGVTQYQVQCDSNNNTSQVIDNNELVVEIFISPARSIEFINLRMIISRTGISFAEIR